MLLAFSVNIAETRKLRSASSTRTVAQHDRTHMYTLQIESVAD